MSTATFKPSTPSGLRVGRIILTLVGLTTAIGCWIADFSDTHIYNPLWLPHAKFHTGQTMSLGTCLGASTLYYLWTEDATVAALTTGKKGDSAANAPAVKAAKGARLRTAVWLASMYWITQLSAWCFPQTAPLDPPADPNMFPFPQFWISGVLLALTGVGYALERRRL